MSIPAPTFKYLMANKTLNSLYIQYLEDTFLSIKTIRNLVAKVTVAYTKRSIKVKPEYSKNYIKGNKKLPQ